MADAGFDNFVRQRFATLLAGEAVPFQILLPSDGSVLQLKARHLKHSLLAGEPVEIFRVTLAGILGLIAPNIDVYYSADAHVLRRFTGISNIRDAHGDNLRVVIDFPPGRLRATDSTDWDENQGRPLASQCTN